MPEPTCLTLPWPPSANHMHYRNRALTEKARNWKLMAWIEIKKQYPPSYGEPVAVTLWFCPPTRHRRDADNSAKAVLDALRDAKVIKDDSGQWLPLLNLRWCDPEKGGAVYIELQEASPEVIAMLCKKPEWAERCR